MIKELRIFNYALGMLNRRKIKNILLVLVFALLVGFFTSIIFMTASLRYEADLVLKNIPELWMQKLAGGRLTAMDQSVRDSLRNIRGIREVIPRIWGYYYDSPTGAVYTVMGVDSSFSGYGYVQTDINSPLLEDQILLGQGYIQSHYLQTGDFVNLIDHGGKMQSFRIAGSFSSQSDLITHDLIVLHPKAARKMLGLQSDEITDIAIRVHNPAETDNIGYKINRRMPSVRIVSREDIKMTYQALFGWRSGIFLFGGLLSILPFLILVWDRATGLSREERKELGVLKSIGWGVNDVLKMKLYESLAVAVTALLLGITAAYIHIYFMEAFLLKPLFIGWSVLYPAYNLIPVVEAESLFMIVMITIAPYLSAALIPAWQAAVIDPAEAMQEA